MVSFSPILGSLFCAFIKPVQTSIITVITHLDSVCLKHIFTDPRFSGLEIVPYAHLFSQQLAQEPTESSYEINRTELIRAFYDRY